MLRANRGIKKTVNQAKHFVIGGATVVVVAEIKVRCLALLTSTFRTSNPDAFDLRLNSHSRLNQIQAIKAGADEAVAGSLARRRTHARVFISSGRPRKIVRTHQGMRKESTPKNE